MPQATHIYKELDLGFSTADTKSAPILSSLPGVLLLRFEDKQGSMRFIGFDGVLSYRWSEGDEDGASNFVSYDRVYEVIDSSWRELLLKLRPKAPASTRHFKLCFNATGSCLDVLANDMQQKDPNEQT